MSYIHDQLGNRKYLTEAERDAFLCAAMAHAPADVGTFCAVLAYTGGRISEILALTPRMIDFDAGVVVIRSLKKRCGTVYRAVPVPTGLLERLERLHSIKAAQRDPERADFPIWRWGRTMAWDHVKRMMRHAGVEGAHAMPKGLRHGFAVTALGSGVPITMVRRWLGHARLETTAHYTEAVGKEERAFAEKLWGSFR